MIAKFKIESQDIWAAQKSMRKIIPKTPLQILLNYVIIPILIFIVYFDRSWNPMVIPLINILIGLLHVLIWIFVAHPLIEKIIFYIRSWNEVQSLKKASEFGLREIIITDDEISIYSKGTTKQYQRKDILKIEYDHLRYFIYFRDNSYFVIKKSPENLSQEDLKVFNNLIEQYIYDIKTKPLRKLPELPTILQIIILIVYFIALMNPNKLWTNPYYQIEKEIFSLFEHVDSKNTSLSVIKSNLTADDINQVRRKFLKIQEEYSPPNNDFHLVNLIGEAEEQYLKKLHTPTEKTNRVYSGESEHFLVNDLELEIIFDKIKVHEGKITVKDKEVFIVDKVRITLKINFDDNSEEIFVLKETASGSEYNMVNSSTGEISNSIYVTNQQGEYITFDNVKDFEIVIEWIKKNDNQIYEEKILLN